MEERLTVDIEKLIPGGKGLCRVDGKVVFVPHVLPGEKVEIRIQEEKKNYSEAELITVLEKSDDRVEPICPLYGECGGCNLQHMNYESQTAAKKDFAANLLKRNAGISINHIPLIASEPFGYRNRVQIHFSNGVRGFRKRSGKDIIAVENCPVSSAGINRFLKCDKDMIREERFTVFGTDEWFSPESENKDISVSLLDREVFFKSSLFFQSNLSLLPYVGKYIRENLKGETLLDLYSGVGLMSSFAEEHFDKIEAVELNHHVEHYIAKNLKKPYTFSPLSLEKWVSRQKGKSRKGGTIIIDPPRTGLSKTVRKYLIGSEAEAILYISCDPATMTRDLKELLADKYVMEDFRLLDFYPQTSHMEAVALLKRG